MKDTKGFYQTIAYWLPKKLIYYCLIRAWANSGQGQWSSEDVTKITADVMIRRWA